MQNVKCKTEILMNIITESDFRRQIKEKPGRGYLLYGDEDYLKTYSLKSLKERLCPEPALEPFNYIKLDGLDLTPSALLDAITTLPMMSDDKLVEVTGMDFTALKAAELDEYLSVLELLPEYEYNTLVISVASGCIDEGKPKSPSATLKKLGERLTLVNFARSTPPMLAKWVGKHFLANGVTADYAVCSQLVDYCGTDMFRLAAETDKLSWYALSNGRETVEPSDIVNVAIADTGYDTFAFTNALTSGNKPEALRVLSEMIRRKIEPTMIMGEVTSMLCDMLTVRMMTDEGASPREIQAKTRIHEYRAKLFLRTGADTKRISAMLALCAEADDGVKKGGKGYGAIERLICIL